MRERERDEVSMEKQGSGGYCRNRENFGTRQTYCVKLRGVESLLRLHRFFFNLMSHYKNKFMTIIISYLYIIVINFFYFFILYFFFLSTKSAAPTFGAHRVNHAPIY